MPYVVTLEDYRPPPREDGVAWNGARLYEAATVPSAGTLIDTFTSSTWAPAGVDADPTSPAARSFTTDAATLAAGWYWVVFTDPASNQAPTDPVFNGPSWIPGYGDVEAKLYARRQSLTQHRPYVEDLIVQGTQHVMAVIGPTLPAGLAPLARHVVALRAAMFTEQALFPEQLELAPGQHDRLRTQYDEELATLTAAIVEAGGDPTTPGTGGGGTAVPAVGPRFVGWGVGVTGDPWPADVD